MGLLKSHTDIKQNEFIKKNLEHNLEDSAKLNELENLIYKLEKRVIELEQKINNLEDKMEIKKELNDLEKFNKELTNY